SLRIKRLVTLWNRRAFFNQFHISFLNKMTRGVVLFMAIVALVYLALTGRPMMVRSKEVFYQLFGPSSKPSVRNGSTVVNFTDLLDAFILDSKYILYKECL